MHVSVGQFFSSHSAGKFQKRNFEFPFLSVCRNDGTLVVCRIGPVKKEPLHVGASPEARRKNWAGARVFHGKLGDRENCAPGGVKGAGPTKEGEGSEGGKRGREGGMMEMSGNFMILWKHEGTAQSYRESLKNASQVVRIRGEKIALSCLQ